MRILLSCLFFSLSATAQQTVEVVWANPKTVEGYKRTDSLLKDTIRSHSLLLIITEDSIANDYYIQTFDKLMASKQNVQDSKTRAWVATIEKFPAVKLEVFYIPKK